MALINVSDPRPAPGAPLAAGAMAVAAVSSIGAGAVHAAAMGAHGEHPQAVRAFALVAVAQVAWGVVALVRPRRVLAAVGLVLNAVLVGAWLLAKARGIGFVDGLGEAEAPQLADGAAAALAAASATGCAVVLARRSAMIAGASSFALAFAAVAVPAVTLPAMVAAGGHHHAHDETATAAAHTHDHSGHTSGTSAANLAAAPVSATPKPYDPTKPIDLGGVPGVTEAQQARAENLVSATLVKLPQFADVATARSRGWSWIGDGGRDGYAHYVNWSLINDGITLDPDKPESLVYQMQDGKPVQLVSAMYMLSNRDNLDTVPDVGGALTQWHVHDDLCFKVGAGGVQVAAVSSSTSPCPSGLVRFPAVPMIHVWIVPNECGPFAALDGVAAGQIKPGETRLCDHAHGSHATGGS